MERSYSNRSCDSTHSYDEYDYDAREREREYPARAEDRLYASGSHLHASRSPAKNESKSKGFGTYWANGNENGNSPEVMAHKEDPDVVPRAMRFSDNLTGSEDVWEDPLKRYQAKREKEVEEISAWDPLTAVSDSPDIIWSWKLN
jgi:hypothetical protein